MSSLSEDRLRQLLAGVKTARVLVVGDVMLDQFIWGTVRRISPEAPVPVVEVDRESFMPGGAANVARNLTALGSSAEIYSVVGKDEPARHLTRLLAEQGVACEGVIRSDRRRTSLKTRVIAHQQQVVRFDRETQGELDERTAARLAAVVESGLDRAEAVIVGDYGKGVVTQSILDCLKRSCRERGIWLSVDPKPVHHLDLRGLSLITPNRKEAFELAGAVDPGKATEPLSDTALLSVVAKLQDQLLPAILLVTLGEQGMLLCQRGRAPFHIPTVAREVFEVSGAGDTVIATFTLAIAAGASPEEAAIFSNHAAGVVVGKVGTATVSAAELVASFREENSVEVRK